MYETCKADFQGGTAVTGVDTTAGRLGGEGAEMGLNSESSLRSKDSQPRNREGPVDGHTRVQGVLVKSTQQGFC